MKSAAILFDFGGTLDGDGIHWSTRFFHEYRHAGIETERESFDRAFVRADQIIAGREGTETLGLREMLALQVALQMDDLGNDAPETAGLIVERLFRSTMDILRRNAAVLRALSAAYLLGIVSNYSGNLRVVCHEAGLTPYLDLLLDSKAIGVSKPNPTIFRLALERLNRAGRECYLVGDSLERDILPAKALGMRTVWVQAGVARSSVPPEVDFRIGSVPELLPILGRGDV